MAISALLRLNRLDTRCQLHLLVLGRSPIPSNFFPVDLVFEGRIYPSVEHAYQAAKSINGEVRAEIAALPRPGDAKRAGDRIDVRADWTDDLRLEVMAHLISLKFETPELAARLLDTGDAELVEGNSWGDTFWGAVNGDGQDHLGRILMTVRFRHRSLLEFEHE